MTGNYWFEVQFTDLTDSAIISADVYSVQIMGLDAGDADWDDEGNPVESTHFIENDCFAIVKVKENDPIHALKRAMLRMVPEEECCG